jgi:hypothetical protein
MPDLDLSSGKPGRPLKSAEAPVRGAYIILILEARFWKFGPRLEAQLRAKP